MTKELGELLARAGYPVTSRGPINVKGIRDPVETFFMALDGSKRNSVIRHHSLLQ